MTTPLSGKEIATTLETLRGARRLIEDEGRWCQGAYARTQHGDVAIVDDSTFRMEGDQIACRWCMLGALITAATDVRRDIVSLHDMAQRLYLGMENPEWPRGTAHDQIFEMQRFNDDRTHPEVLAVYDRAIARLEGGLI